MDMRTVIRLNFEAFFIECQHLFFCHIIFFSPFVDWGSSRSMFLNIQDYISSVSTCIWSPKKWNAPLNPRKRELFTSWPVPDWPWCLYRSSTANVKVLDEILQTHLLSKYQQSIYLHCFIAKRKSKVALYLWKLDCKNIFYNLDHEQLINDFWYMQCFWVNWHTVCDFSRSFVDYFEPSCEDVFF